MQSCPCNDCNGLPRHKRTIRKHLSLQSQCQKDDSKDPKRPKLNEESSVSEHDDAPDFQEDGDNTKLPCFCCKCAGIERDLRTVNAHLLNIKVVPPCQDSCHSLAKSDPSREFYFQNRVVVHSSTQPTSSNYAGNNQLPFGRDDIVNNDNDFNENANQILVCNDDQNGNDIIYHDGQPANPQNPLGNAEGNPNPDANANQDHDAYANPDLDADPAHMANPVIDNPDPMADPNQPNPLENHGNNDLDPEDPEDDQQYEDDESKLKRAILRIIHCKIKYGMSQEQTLQQLRNLFELTNDDRIPHSSWNNVISFLKQLGFQKANCFKVCFGDDHVSLLQDNEDCTDCGKSWNKCTNYHVLGVQMEDIFVSQQSIKEHMEHWQNRHDWFNIDEITVPRTEIWHGDRFKELSYFWDENTSTLLPTICPNCEELISPADIQRMRPDGIPATEGFVLTCHCGYTYMYVPKFMKGCPLNQVYIFHEDGFNAFFTSTRGTAAIHLTNACTSKVDRAKNTKVYSFIPATHIKEGIKHKLDAFFQPLLDEIIDLYINGKKIHLDEPLQIGDTIIHAGDHQVRALIILGSADIKAHAELLLYASGGKTGCRRCLVKGQYLEARKHYYYGEFRQRHRYPPEERTHQYHHEHGARCEHAPTNAAFQQIRKDTGCSGVSFMYVLQKLYGFDPIRDMTVDKMHLSVNMLKREFTERMWKDLAENDELNVNERVVQNGGLINRTEFKSALEAVQWTKQLKDKGVPKIKKLSDRLSGWKHDDYIKFSTVAREVLACKIPSKAFDVFLLACHMTHMLYSKRLHRQGWTEEDIVELSNTSWAHAIKAEEYYGLDVCSENLEYSVHLADDIRRHSSPDNYSCEVFERAIRIHKQQSNNSKGVEVTFAERESIRSFLNTFELRNGPLSRYEERLPFRFDMALLEHADNQLFLHEKSFDAAVKLITELERTDNPITNELLKCGVALGKITQEHYTHQFMQDVRRQLRQLYPDMHNLNQLLIMVRTVPAIVKRNTFGDFTKFAKGDACIIAGGEDLQEDWYIVISKITKVGPIAGSYHLMVDGTYYIPAFQNGNVVKHPWTQTIQLLPRQYARFSIQLARNLKRKVILYPDPSNIDEPAFYLPIDFDEPLLMKDVKVPVWPQEGDVLSIKGIGGATWYGRVNEVRVHERCCQILWLRETRQNGVCGLTRQMDNVNFDSIIQQMHIMQVAGGYRFDDN